MTLTQNTRGAVTKVLTADEAEALFEAAEFARKNSWHINHLGDRLAVLNRAISKLRRATTLHIEPTEY